MHADRPIATKIVTQEVETGSSNEGKATDEISLQAQQDPELIKQSESSDQEKTLTEIATASREFQRSMDLFGHFIKVGASMDSLIKVSACMIEKSLPTQPPDNQEAWPSHTETLQTTEVIESMPATSPIQAER